MELSRYTFEFFGEARGFRDFDKRATYNSGISTRA